jgi:hypothetical protein
MIANDDINDDVKASPSLIQKITMSRKKASSTDPSLEMGCEPGGASNENERSMEEEDFFFLMLEGGELGMDMQQPRPLTPKQTSAPIKDNTKEGNFVLSEDEFLWNDPVSQ